LSDVHFLQMMARCSGLVCTAGFESTCEAMYLGKTILAVPVKGHAEQYWNALDLAGFGGGVYAASFDIDRLEEARRRLVPPTRILRAWVDQAPERILGEIEAVLHRRVTAVG
jgi:UDP:flavonoid glycosyltransferase YjiC (YdhE family)